jgi:hypothetical protein
VIFIPAVNQTGTTDAVGKFANNIRIASGLDETWTFDLQPYWKCSCHEVVGHLLSCRFSDSSNAAGFLGGKDGIKSCSNFELFQDCS